MSKTTPDKSATLRRERQRLLRELASLSLMIRGSLFERFSTCTRPSCPCHKGKLHGPRCYVAVTAQKRQKQHYVPQSQGDAVRCGVEQYHRLVQILDRITTINLRLMRGGHLHESTP